MGKAKFDLLGVFFSHAEGALCGGDTTKASWGEQPDISPAESDASDLCGAVMETEPWSGVVSRKETL